MADEPTPNDQMVEPTVSNEDMEAFIQSLETDFEYSPSVKLSAPDQQPPDDAPTDEPPDEEQPTEEPGEEPPADSDFITVRGQQIPRADIERLYEFDQYMRQNPETAQRVSQALAQPPAQPTGESPVPAAPPPEAAAPTFVEPQPPEGFDLDDPQIKFLWDQNVNTQRQIWEQGRQVADFARATQSQQQTIIDAQARADMDSALSQFRAEFPGLNDDDVASVRQEAAPLLPAMMQNLAPIDAIKRSMEVAAWANADMRPKLSAEESGPTEKEKSTRRKRLAGQISGSPRSAPKVESRPSFTSDRDMVNALAQEFAEQMGR